MILLTNMETDSPAIVAHLAWHNLTMTFV